MKTTQFSFFKNGFKDMRFGIKNLILDLTDGDDIMGSLPMQCAKYSGLCHSGIEYFHKFNNPSVDKWNIVQIIAAVYYEIDLARDYVEFKNEVEILRYFGYALMYLDMLNLYLDGVKNV